MSEQSDLHNRLAGTIVAQIVKPPLEAGGQTSDVLVLLESVVAGVMMACAKLNGWSPAGRDAMLMTLESGVRERLVEMEVRS